jgi:hypothetical protein
MKAIISTIDELRKTIKISKSIPFDVVEPFIDTARDVYLERYLGTDLLNVLEQDTPPDKCIELLELTRKALGPLAMMTGYSELSVRIGDSGFTVESRTGTNGGSNYVPASDTKIANVSESFERRGFAHLDKVLEYLEANADTFPEWKESRFYTLRGGNYIKSAVEFQEIGYVNIDYSRLTFEHLRPLMSMVEARYVTELLGEELDTSLKSASFDRNNAIKAKLKRVICAFVACKCAELHTSVATKTQRESGKSVEYKPIIRPIYTDVLNSGNYFADQSGYFFSKMEQIILQNASQLGIEVIETALNWNTGDNSFFAAEG